MVITSIEHCNLFQRHHWPFGILETEDQFRFEKRTVSVTSLAFRRPGDRGPMLLCNTEDCTVKNCNVVLHENLIILHNKKLVYNKYLHFADVYSMGSTVEL